MDDLKDRRLRTTNAIERCKKSLKAIDTYIDKLAVQHLGISELGKAMDTYDSTEERLEEKIISLNKEIVSLDERIEEEDLRLKKQVGSRKLRTQVVVGLYAESAGAVDITVNVIYGTPPFFFCNNSTLVHIHAHSST